jgi:hypothetical protein
MSCALLNRAPSCCVCDVSAVLIDHELSYDERNDNVLDNLSTQETGVYQFDVRCGS